MKIDIIGGGAIGFLVASYLCEQHHSVTIYTRRKEQADQLNTTGLTRVVGGQLQTFFLQAHPLSYYNNSDAELAIVCVKQTVMQDLVKSIKDVQRPFIFLQNGMGHLSLLKQLTCETIGIGIVSHGSLKINDTMFEHTGHGIMRLSTYKGEDSTIKRFCEEMDAASFPVEYRTSYKEMMYEKLVINAIINPLTALYRIPNGELIVNEAFYSIMKRLYNEIMSVIPFSKDPSFAEVVNVCEKTAANRSSMLKDIEEKRQTEVDAILGFVLDQAKEKQIVLPLTRFLYESIKGLEEGAMRRQVR